LLEEAFAPKHRELAVVTFLHLVLRNKEDKGGYVRKIRQIERDYTIYYVQQIHERKILRYSFKK